MQIVVNRINWKVVAADVLLVGAACLIPAFSHLTALPLYKVDPMRWLLLAGLLLSARRANGYVLAVALPLVACLLSGMPAPAKAFVIAIELSANVAIYQLLEKRLPVLPAMLLAILGAKAVYYLLKWLVLSPDTLVGTGLWLQLGTTVAMCVLFALCFTIKNRK